MYLIVNKQTSAFPRRNASSIEKIFDCGFFIFAFPTHALNNLRQNFKFFPNEREIGLSTPDRIFLRRSGSAQKYSGYKTK